MSEKKERYARQELRAIAVKVPSSVFDRLSREAREQHIPLGQLIRAYVNAEEPQLKRGRPRKNGTEENNAR